MGTIGLYHMRNDLRLDDNAVLLRAAQEVDKLIIVYCVDPSWFNPVNFQSRAMGLQRWRFLRKTLKDLDNNLQAYKQNLQVIYQSSVNALTKLIVDFDVTHVYRSKNAGFNENQEWLVLQDLFTHIHFAELDTHTLYTQTQLPFELSQLSFSFTKFRKLIEKTASTEALGKPLSLPPSPISRSDWDKQLPTIVEASETSFISTFTGGERAASQHIKHYFNSSLPSSYKNVRNSLDGWENSTKLSPWLANGSLSPRRVLSMLDEYECSTESNESTYWIYFELLWREYFQWYSHAHGSRLFHFRGLQSHSPLTSFYPERFKRWCTGSTPYPLVNACMKQLNATGYMSNRGRQIVASCLINELSLDWRYGAAYFEQQLIDYDVSVNWGNWQYLAGVGTNTRGQRHFNIEKQTQLFDSEHKFITKWQGQKNCQPFIDSVDAADWPILRE